MKKVCLLILSTIVGVVVGYIGTNLIRETNIIRNSGVFHEGPDNPAPVFAGLIIFPMLSLCSGYFAWRILRGRLLK